LTFGEERPIAMTARLASIILLLASIVQAVPVPPTEPIDLTGRVHKWAWIDGTVSKSSGEGMLLAIRTVPTYYIILKVEGVPEQTRNSLSSLARFQGRVAIMHPIAAIKLGPDEILVSLDLDLMDSIHKGSNLKIAGYTMQGDEWGCSSDWSELLVDGKAIPKRNRKAEQGGAGEPATRPESDSEGGDKLQPESEGRSR
jgi:hypothetical protein